MQPPRGGPHNDIGKVQGHLTPHHGWGSTPRPHLTWLHLFSAEHEAVASFQQNLGVDPSLPLPLEVGP